MIDAETDHNKAVRSAREKSQCSGDSGKGSSGLDTLSALSL